MYFEYLSIILPNTITSKKNNIIVKNNETPSDIPNFIKIVPQVMGNVNIEKANNNNTKISNVFNNIIHTIEIILFITLFSCYFNNNQAKDNTLYFPH